MTTTDADSGDPTPGRARAAFAFVVAVAILLAYWPALSGGFLEEDWSRVPRAHAARAVLGTDAHEIAPTAAQNAPLPRAVLAATYRAAGFEPRAFRVLALVVHVLTAWLVGRIARRWFRDARAGSVAAGVFGLHPVAVPLVATLAGLDAAMALLLGLVALDAYETSATSKRRAPLVTCAAIAWALALACDRWALAVPTLALAAALARRRAFAMRAANERAPSPLPLAIASACALALLIALPNAAAQSLDDSVGLSRRILLRAEMLGGVVRDLAWPPAVRIFPPFRPALGPGDPALVVVWIAIVALAIATIVAWRRRASTLFAALVFVPLALLPALVSAERLLPFPLSGTIHGAPLVGFALCTAAIAHALPKHGLVTIVVCTAPLVLGVLTARRLPAWADERALYTRAVLESPASPTLRWRLGHALLDEYREQGDRGALARAGSAFQTALDQLEKTQHGDRSTFATSNDFLQSNLGLGWALLHEDAAEGYVGDETALSVFRTLVERYPRSTEAQVGYSVAASALGRDEEAEAALEQALAIDSRPAETWHDLGIVRARRGDWKGADEAFEEALRRRPDHVDDLLLLARARVQANDVSGASEPIAHAARVDPKNPGPLWLQATVAASKRDFDAALAHVRAALELAPEDGESWLLKGKIHLALGEKHAAFTALERAADLLPASFETHYNLAALLLERNEFAAALPELESAYAVRPATAAGGDLRRTLRSLDLRDADLIARLAAHDARRGRLEDAEEWLARALALRPDHGPSHAVRGRMLWRAGRAEEAQAELEKACASLPNDFALHFDLAVLLTERGRKDAARARFESALAIAARDPGLESQSAARMVREKLERWDAESR
ncbi:MAG: tetratricopeptide repeat protein [Planctomycetota bacterium]